MPSTCIFRDQVGVVTSWFRTWNECERTVALYSLLRKVAPVQGRFLLHVLEQSVQGCGELSAMEERANSADYVQSLCLVPRANAVRQLLVLLPLLRSTSSAAKSQYLDLIPLLLRHSLEHGEQLEESRQLLSYVLIHPALGVEEREAFKRWLNCLDEQQLGEKTRLLRHHTEVAPDPLWRHGNRDSGIGLDSNGSVGGMASTAAEPQETQSSHRPLTRSPSLSSPISQQTTVSDWLSTLGVEDQASRDASPLSPQNSTTSSGSGSDGAHAQKEEEFAGGGGGRNTFMEEGSGMKDVPTWLKALRLHKYSHLFQTLTYDVMLSIDEAWLEKHNVTKGARNKILLSVQKLRDRPQQLKNIERDILESGSIATLKGALAELKTMLNTPMKPQHLVPDEDADVDLAGQFVRVLGKVCTQLLVCQQRPDDDCCSAYVQLLERCCNHEAFKPKQRKLLSSWKQQIGRVWSGPVHRYALTKQQRVFGSTFPLAHVGRQRALRGSPSGLLHPPNSAGQSESIWNKVTSSNLSAAASPASQLAVPASHLSLFRNHSLSAAYSRAALEPPLWT